MEQAKVELEVADGQIQEAQGAYQQAVEELATKSELQRRNASTVAQRDIEKLENVVNGRQGGVAAIAPTRSPSRRRFPHYCRHRRPVLRQRWTKPRSNSTRRWFAHMSTA